MEESLSRKKIHVFVPLIFALILLSDILPHLDPKEPNPPQINVTFDAMLQNWRKPSALIAVLARLDLRYRRKGINCVCMQQR